jgi:hypothetical protein
VSDEHRSASLPSAPRKQAAWFMYDITKAIWAQGPGWACSGPQSHSSPGVLTASFPRPGGGSWRSENTDSPTCLLSCDLDCKRGETGSESL